MSAKPKFKVGQIVVIRGTDEIVRIGSRNGQMTKRRYKTWFYWRANSESLGFGERDLRPLTKREAGR